MGDIAAAAIRGARINIDMEEFAGGVFPVFARREEYGNGAIEEDESDGMWWAGRGCLWKGCIQ